MCEINLVKMIKPNGASCIICFLSTTCFIQYGAELIFQYKFGHTNSFIDFSAFSIFYTVESNTGEPSLWTKLQRLRVCVFSMLLYASENWTLKKDDERGSKAFGMKCSRR